MKKTKKKQKVKVSEAIKKAAPRKPYEKMFGNQFARKWFPEDIERMGDKLLQWMETNASCYWFKDFCIQEKISPQNISEWAQGNSYFAWCLSIVKMIQEARLVDRGMRDKGSMPIFALKNVAGWKDRLDLTGFVGSVEDVNWPTLSPQQLVSLANGEQLSKVVRPDQMVKK